MGMYGFKLYILFYLCVPVVLFAGHVEAVFWCWVLKSSLFTHVFAVNK